MVLVEGCHWTGQAGKNYFPKFFKACGPMLREVPGSPKHWWVLLANYNLELCFCILDISVITEFSIFALKCLPYDFFKIHSHGMCCFHLKLPELILHLR